MRDAAGREVGPYDLWQASAMANATRDPLFRAAVSVEALATPSAAAAIEAKCLSCHAPMAARSPGTTLELAMLERDGPAEQLALDGVSCTLCHQLEAPVDVAATFDGGYDLAATRTIYGPYDDPQGSPMYLRTGYQPLGGAHITQSSACASCHTLTTHAVDAAGRATGGSVLEQSPYLEWQNSVFNDELPTPSADAASCQACHVPRTDEDGLRIQTKVARTLSGDFTVPDLAERDPFGRHVFLGGNTLLPQLLREQRADLAPLAPDEALLELERLTRDQLRRRTAQVSIEGLARDAERLTFAVRVETLTGHKFPTGHPTRRAWLRVRLRDAGGRVVFASGEFDARGRIVDRSGQPLPTEVADGPLQPHHERITGAGQVQVYQAVMADRSGAPTFLLLRGEGYVKDNRLLPRGWDDQHPNAAATRPQGQAAADVNFTGGGDLVRFELDAPAAAGPYRVEASVHYQPLGARAAAELLRHETPEVAAFRHYYAQTDARPSLVDETSAREP